MIHALGPEESGYLIPAAVAAISSGMAAIMVAAPGMIRAIREEESDDLKAFVRRLYYMIKDRPVWDELPGDIQKDMESISDDYEKKSSRKRQILGRGD